MLQPILYIDYALCIVLTHTKLATDGFFFLWLFLMPMIDIRDQLGSRNFDEGLSSAPNLKKKKKIGIFFLYFILFYFFFGMCNRLYTTNQERAALHRHYEIIRHAIHDFILLAGFHILRTSGFLLNIKTG
jgi:hypothetical protein